MKKLFILAVAITSSLLFVQCKKTETLVPQEEVLTLAVAGRAVHDRVHAGCGRVLYAKGEPFCKPD